MLWAIIQYYNIYSIAQTVPALAIGRPSVTEHQWSPDELEDGRAAVGRAGSADVGRSVERGVGFPADATSRKANSTWKV